MYFHTVEVIYMECLVHMAKKQNLNLFKNTNLDTNPGLNNHGCHTTDTLLI